MCTAYRISIDLVLWGATTISERLTCGFCMRVGFSLDLLLLLVPANLFGLRISCPDS